VLNTAEWVMTGVSNVKDERAVPTTAAIVMLVASFDP
jgi:hypothetical protein